MQPTAELGTTAGPPSWLAAVLAAAAKDYASDVHLRPGRPVWIRRGGDFSVWEEDEQPVSEDAVAAARRWICPDSASTVRTVIAAGCRWRALSFRAGAVLRRIEAEPPVFEQLGLPEVVRDFTKFSSGLVVVAGETGSGKSSTIASLLAETAAMKQCHILTIEDPLEHVIPDGRSLVTQQEVPKECHEQALEEALRADIDVVMLGESRLPAHFELCLTLAATGHLVFTTIHASDALEVCERIVSGTRASGRSMLSATLRAVLSQRLIPSRVNPRKRYCATEVMVVDSGIKAVLRPSKEDLSMLRPKIDGTPYSLLRSLAALVRDGKISEEAAMAESPDPEEFEKILRAT
ncbi:MAG: hypothetical protein F4Z31_01670 [Gemmatimonadetes bacterium]|nr:hypothetical protein [Gemmatimonadota bacterium]